MTSSNNTYPTWTDRDMYDTGVYALHRERLWLCNYGASVWPQIYSWIVVNVYPASSRHDYRFDDNFMNRAILVTVDWDTSGKGCENTSCYPTFPTRRGCSETEGPVLFPSGDLTTVTACQPACFMLRRTKQLMKSMNRDEDMYGFDELAVRGLTTDDCPTCKYITESAAYRTNRWLYGGPNEIEEYDVRDESLKRKRRIASFARARFDEKNTLKRNADMLSFKWDHKYNNCILIDETFLRTVVEPPYRNPTPKCKSTNFEVGEDVIWGLRFKEGDPRFEPNYSFAVGRSSAYCRAFNKERDPKTKNCYTPWWIKALTYTLVGDGIIHGIHSLVHYEHDCLDPWRVGSNDRAQVKVSFDSTSNYYKWQRDVNAKFVLPPPNVTLSDLGIDVKLTGNRLYWNNVEGIVSQLAMFRTVEELTAGVTSTSSTLSARSPRSMSLSTRLSSATDRFVPNENSDHRYSRSTLYRTYNDDNGNGYLSEEYMRDNGGSGDDDNDVENHENRSNRNRETLNSCRDLIREKIKRLRERKINKREDLIDHDLDKRIRDAWPKVKESLTSEIEQRSSDTKVWKSRSRRLPIGSSSVPYRLYQYEFLTQKLLSVHMNNDPSSALLPAVTASKLNPSRTIEELREQRRQGNNNDPKDEALDLLLEDMMNVLSKNEIMENLRDMGISLSFDLVVQPLIVFTLKRLFNQTLRMISLYTERVVSSTLLRVGLRIAATRSIAATVTALSVRSMLIASEAASVVGIVLAVTGLVSLVFDLALTAGWDPGNFRNESDLSVYHDMAKYFAETMNAERRGEVEPLDMLKMMYETVSTDQQDFDTVKETLIAQQQNKPPNDDNNDNDNNDDDVPSVIPLPGDDDDDDDDVPSVVPLPGDDDDDDVSSVVPLPGDGNDNNLSAVVPPLTNRNADDNSVKRSKRKTVSRKTTSQFSDIKEKMLHVNERLTKPKWFNKQFTECFAKNYKTHSIITNSLSFWNIVNTFDYLGSLQTNSFGQRLVSYPKVVRLNESDIASLITETSYRKLLTTTSKTNLDNRTYNRRVEASKRGNRLFGFIGLGIGAIGLIVTIIPKFWQTDRRFVQFHIPFPVICTLLTCVAILSFVFAILVMVPVKASFDDIDGGNNNSNNNNNNNNNNDDDDDDDDETNEIEAILKNDANKYWKLSSYVDRLRQMVVNNR